MEKFFKSKKVSTILSLLTVLFGIVALILFFTQGVGFENPVVWVMILLVLAAIGELLTVSNKDK